VVALHGGKGRAPISRGAQRGGTKAAGLAECGAGFKQKDRPRAVSLQLLIGG